MISTSRIAVAVGSGYLLGRTKKLRFALVIGGAVTGRRIPTSVIDLFRLGVRLVADAPELAPLREVVRGPLLGAATQAGVAAAGYHMEALTRRLAAVSAVLEEPDTGPALGSGDGAAASEVLAVTVEIPAEDTAPTPGAEPAGIVIEGVPA